MGIITDGQTTPWTKHTRPVSDDKARYAQHADCKWMDSQSFFVDAPGDIPAHIGRASTDSFPSAMMRKTQEPAECGEVDEVRNKRVCAVKTKQQGPTEMILQTPNKRSTRSLHLQPTPQNPQLPHRCRAFFLFLSRQ